MAERLSSAEHAPGLETVSWGVSVLANPVWETTRKFLVAQYWVGAVRLLRWDCPANHPSLDYALRRWFISTVCQRDIHKEIHVASTKSRSIAVQWWANVYIDDDQKREIAEWDISTQEVLDVFSALVFDGYRLSVTFDDYSQALQASLVCSNPELGNYECGLSARHPDIDMVLRTLLYKHKLTEDTGYREFASKPRSPSWS